MHRPGKLGIGSAHQDGIRYACRRRHGVDVSELWRSLEFDSFPVLYFSVLRAWTAVFGADNDLALRVWVF